MSDSEEKSEVNPGDSASQCGGSVASTTSSSRARRTAAAKRVALLAEAKVLKEQQELEFQQLKLSQQMADLKLKARIASAEAEEKVYAEFEETVSYPIQEPKQEQKTTQPPVDLPPSSRPPDQSSSLTKDNSLYTKEMIQLTQHHQRSMVEMMQLPKAELM